MKILGLLWCRGGFVGVLIKFLGKLFFEFYDITRGGVVVVLLLDREVEVRGC